MKQRITYYSDGTNVHAVTNECPAGFKNTLYVGRGPDDKSTIIEQLYEVNRLKKMTVVNPDNDTKNALGYETIEEVPVLDIQGENLLDLMPMRRQRRPRSNYVLDTELTPEELARIAHNKYLVTVGVAAGVVLAVIIQCL